MRHPLGPSSLLPPELTAWLFSTVSNEVPEHPCVSPVSNHVYERRLIEKYIAENGTDPINNQPLSEEQLIDIKGALGLPQSRVILAQSLRRGRWCQLTGGGASDLAMQAKGRRVGQRKRKGPLGSGSSYLLFLSRQLLTQSGPSLLQPPASQPF